MWREKKRRSDCCVAWGVVCIQGYSPLFTQTRVQHLEKVVEETTYTGSSIWPSREDKLSHEKNVTTFRKGHAERDISDSTASVFVSDFKGRHWTRSMVWASRCGEMFSSSLAHWLIDTAHFTVHRLWFRWLLSVAGFGCSDVEAGTLLSGRDLLLQGEARSHFHR